MKDELTELMHSEFTISPEMEICNRVGSAMQSARILGKTEKEIPNILKRYNVTMDDYNKWKDHWQNLE